MGIDATIIGQMKSQKGKSECLPWDSVNKFLAKCEDQEWVFNVFSIAMYGMVIFLKISNHIEVVVVDLVEKVNNQANHVPVLLWKPFVHRISVVKRAKVSLLDVSWGSMTRQGVRSRLFIT